MMKRPFKTLIAQAQKELDAAKPRSRDRIRHRRDALIRAQQIEKQIKIEKRAA